MLAWRSQVFVCFKAFVHERIIPFLPLPICIAHPGAHSTTIGQYMIPPPTSRLYAIHHTIMEITISRKGQMLAVWVSNTRRAATNMGNRVRFSLFCDSDADAATFCQRRSLSAGGHSASEPSLARSTPPLDQFLLRVCSCALCVLTVCDSIKLEHVFMSYTGFTRRNTRFVFLWLCHRNT